MDRFPTPRGAWLIFNVALLAYAVAVFQRASLGVAGVEVQRRFATTAAVVSLFAVLQLAVYASLQVPVGVVLDRLGSRRLIAAGALLMATGQLVMATAHAVGLAVTGRVLVGAGDAMTFISVLRLVAAWFPPGRVALMTQMTGLLGQAGQIVAAYPLVALLQGAGWSTSFLTAAGVGFAVGVLALTLLRNAPPGAHPPEAPIGWGEAARRLGLAWREPGTRLGLWTHFSTQFSGAVFGLLWGYPFLVVGERCSPADAGILITLLVVVVLVVLVIVLASNGPGSLMGFDYARTENEAERIGSATGIVNVGGFVASLLMIALIGVILSVRSSGGRRPTRCPTSNSPLPCNTSSGPSASSACCTTAAACAPHVGSSSTPSRTPWCAFGVGVAPGHADALELPVLLSDRPGIHGVSMRLA